MVWTGLGTQKGFHIPQECLLLCPERSTVNLYKHLNMGRPYHKYLWVACFTVLVYAVSYRLPS